jgi:hypothetical protein
MLFIVELRSLIELIGFTLSGEAEAVVQKSPQEVDVDDLARSGMTEHIPLVTHTPKTFG